MKIATFFLCFHGLLQCDQSIMLYPSTGPKNFLTVHILRARPKIELHLVLLNKKIVPAQTLNVLMPCPFTGPKMFWVGLKFFDQTKN